MKVSCDNSNLLNDPKVIQWCYEGVTEISLKNCESEKKVSRVKGF